MVVTQIDRWASLPVNGGHIWASHNSLERGTVTAPNSDIILGSSSWRWIAAPPPIFRVIIIFEVMVWMALMAPTPMYLENRLGWRLSIPAGEGGIGQSPKNIAKLSL